MSSPKTVTCFGAFLGGWWYLREFFSLFKTTRFNIAVAGDYASSSWKSVCALHTGEKFLCKNIMHDK